MKTMSVKTVQGIVAAWPCSVRFLSIIWYTTTDDVDDDSAIDEVVVEDADMADGLLDCEPRTARPMAPVKTIATATAAIFLVLTTPRRFKSIHLCGPDFPMSGEI